MENLSQISAKTARERLSAALYAGNALLSLPGPGRGQKAAWIGQPRQNYIRRGSINDN
jgi:hypothetical protein